MSKHKNRRTENHIVYRRGNYFRKKYQHLVRGTMCDIGCGDLFYKSYYAGKYEKYIGVDWYNSDQSNYLRSDLNQGIDLEDQTVDCIICFSLIEHLHSPQRCLSEIYRILKSGGSLQLQVPFSWHLHEEPHDYYRYTKYALDKIIKEAGFSEIHIEAQSGPATVIAVKFSYLIIKIMRKIKYFGSLLTALAHPLLISLQILAWQIDRYIRSEYDTIGYFVTAQKE